MVLEVRNGLSVLVVVVRMKHVVAKTVAVRMKNVAEKTMVVHTRYVDDEIVGNFVAANQIQMFV